MLNVTIKVVHATQSGSTVSVTNPVNDERYCEINLGLIMQYHLVGLDKQVIPVSTSDSVNVVNHSILNNPSLTPDVSNSHLCSLNPIPMSHSEQDSEHVDITTPNTKYNTSSNSSSNSNDHIMQVLYDKVMEDDDEHTRQITGGPLASMMTIENPEACN